MRNVLVALFTLRGLSLQHSGRKGTDPQVEGRRKIKHSLSEPCGVCVSFPHPPSSVNLVVRTI